MEMPSSCLATENCIHTGIEVAYGRQADTPEPEILFLRELRIAACCAVLSSFPSCPPMHSAGRADAGDQRQRAFPGSKRPIGVIVNADP